MNPLDGRIPEEIAPKFDWELVAYLTASALVSGSTLYVIARIAGLVLWP